MRATLFSAPSLLAAASVLAWPTGAGAQPAPSAAPAPVPAARKVDCSAVLAKLRADFAREPGRLLLSVEDALTTSEVCACPIVRTAVNFAGSNTDLTGQIVVAAIRMVPAASARITECALAEAPDAGTAIRSAIAKELGESSVAWLDPASKKAAEGSSLASEPAALPAGKSPLGKAGVPAADPEMAPDEGGEPWPSIGITGIYLTVPAQTGVQRTAPGPPKIRYKVITTRKWSPRRPVSPVTRSLPE